MPTLSSSSWANAEHQMTEKITYGLRLNPFSFRANAELRNATLILYPKGSQSLFFQGQC